MDILSACRSILLGHAIADSMGVPVEFEDRTERQLDPVVGIRGYGTFNQPPGTFSDDFSLTACLAESLCASGSQRVDLTDLGNRFTNWLRYNYWAADSVFDIGIATRAAIERLERGSPAERAGGNEEFDNGNGSIMRILPLLIHPLWQNGSPDERQALTERVASVTHRHPRSIFACCLYLEIANQLLHGRSCQDAYAEVCRTFIPSLSKRLKKEEVHFSRILDGKLGELPEGAIESGGYIVHTLEASLWCLLRQETYAATVLAAVNLGFDTDTTAAVAGGLAALAYGEQDIPDSWLGILARRNDIEDLAERLATRICS
ncbi:ADP-ribosylglycohydrolase family protein [Hymenobacter persicinus]|uniref:ADP-ribosylglycohydrolase family protein n=2 Tax=Hymenobacter persicinus TaxID=2025506 RepID=A0A4Q5LD99_9BACT|nr:ADP-ribosylglycohydrolase family protein [Hymenobacter persicinus]